MYAPPARLKRLSTSWLITMNPRAPSFLLFATRFAGYSFPRRRGTCSPNSFPRGVKVYDGLELRAVRRCDRREDSPHMFHVIVEREVESHNQDLGSR